MSRYLVTATASPTSPLAQVIVARNSAHAFEQALRYFEDDLRLDVLEGHATRID